MGSFPNSYLIVNSFQMFSQTVSAWRQYTQINIFWGIKRFTRWTALSSDLIIAQIIHTGDLFTAIQQSDKNLLLQKQMIWNLPGISYLCKSTLELGWLL
jgi:hypothetical protein